MAVPSLPSGGNLDLLLIGKTGHGKSSTGNSILMKNYFKVSSDTDSVTQTTEVTDVCFNGRIIKVVDTPGIFDTHFSSSKEGLQALIKAFSRVISEIPDGFHALVLILRFGIRMTDEEKKAIDWLKKVFGLEIVKNHVVLVITYGDDFHRNEERLRTFKEWCKGQKCFMRDFLAECQGRCVLFNNKEEDETKRKAQVIELITMVDIVSNHGKNRYTSTYFDRAKQERVKLLAELQMSELEDDGVRQDVHVILNHLDNILQKTDGQATSEDLSVLTDRREDLKKRCPEGSQFHKLTMSVCALVENVHTNQEKLKTSQSEVKEYYDTNVARHLNSVNERAAKAVSEIMTCFPGTSTVTLANGTCITLEELQTGDKVLARKDENDLHYDTVYMFGHQETESFNHFICLKTAIHSVCVTKGHYVYCMKDGGEQCIAAENVSIGDSLLVATPDGLMPRLVESITYEMKKGLLAPFTMSGTIVVDGALMSCYIDVLPAKICHKLLLPMRHLYRVSPRILNFINGSTKQHPVPRWAKLALRLI